MVIAVSVDALCSSTPTLEKFTPLPHPTNLFDDHIDLSHCFNRPPNTPVSRLHNEAVTGLKTLWRLTILNQFDLTQD